MRRPTVLMCALALGAAACTSSDIAGGDASTTLTVFAASSLGDAFSESIGPAFEAAHEGVTVVFNLGASDALAGQIQSEGSADVFASASDTWMDAVQDDPGVTDRTDFARNRLVIIVPPGNPAEVSSIEDLAAEGTQLVLAAEGVPAGDYAREALANAGIADEADENIVSNEEDDASVVAKVAAGEADAGIVYASDVSAAAENDVEAIEIAEDVNVTATYPIAVVSGTPHAELASAFVDYVTSAEGQDALTTYGFEAVE